MEDNSTPANRADYNKACAKVKLTVKDAKKENWQKTTADLNLDREGNKAWSLLKNLSGDKRTRNPTPMEDHGSTLASDQKKAEHINKFFASVSRAVDLTEQDTRSKTSKVRRKPLNKAFPFLKRPSAKMNLDTH